MKTSIVLRVLGLLLAVAEISVFVGLGLSYYTIVRTMMGTLGEGGGSPVQANYTIDPSTGALNGTISITFRNSGMLDVGISISIKLASEDGTTLYLVSARRQLQPGSSAVVSMPLNLPASVLQRIRAVNLGLGFKSLFDLVGFSIVLPLPAQLGCWGPPPEVRSR